MVREFVREVLELSQCTISLQFRVGVRCNKLLLGQLSHRRNGPRQVHKDVSRSRIASLQSSSRAASAALAMHSRDSIVIAAHSTNLLRFDNSMLQKLAIAASTRDNVGAHN